MKEKKKSKDFVSIGCISLSLIGSVTYLIWCILIAIQNWDIQSTQSEHFMLFLKPALYCLLPSMIVISLSQTIKNLKNKCKRTGKISIWGK